MTIHVKCFFAIFIYIIFYSDAQLLNCPQSQIKFEKLIGIRPNPQERNTLFHSSRNNTPVTLECLTKCANDRRCSSFLLYYNTSECYQYTNVTATTLNYDYDSRPDTNVVWFRKTCLNADSNCGTKAWAVEILAGATLVGYNTRKISGKITRQQCIENCIQERKFSCKSVKFTVDSKLKELEDANPMGYCTLSNTNRHLTTNAFRVSRYEDEYIENECINTTYTSDYCAYEEYDNVTLEHTDLLFTNMTQRQCENMCDISMAFNCRGYSLVPNIRRPSQNKNSQTFTCLLHSEDSKLIGPKLLVNYQGGKFYERARCLNVSVSCTSDLMKIIYQPEQSFTGRIYTNGYSDKPPCYADGRFNATISLNIPLNNSQCGLTEAHSAEPVSRTLRSVLLVIQYNSLIQTQADRLIKVGCVYGNDDEDPEITLGTSVNFTSSYPNRGSTIVNSSTVLPTVSIRIVDYNTKAPTADTEIGQELQMIIDISPGDGPYDIWAGNLIATSGNNTLQLLDENGCPTNLNIFSPFTKIHTNTSRMLVSNFQAFKFPSTPLVRFSVMVHFCTLTCPQMRCVNEEYPSRLKRETIAESNEQLAHGEINATVYKLNQKKNTNETDEEMIEEMPLNILLVVKGVNIAPDQLVYGENNRILVAGYDYVTNEVCLDYSLFVGLLVVWVLLQVIIVVCCYLLIRKYKKYFHIAYTRQLDDMHQNFGFGSRDINRRVHWADQ